MRTAGLYGPGALQHNREKTWANNNTARNPQMTGRVCVYTRLGYGVSGCGCGVAQPDPYRTRAEP
jgi:hypothetical protein